MYPLIQLAEAQNEIGLSILNTLNKLTSGILANSEFVMINLVDLLDGTFRKSVQVSPDLVVPKIFRHVFNLPLSQKQIQRE